MKTKKIAAIVLSALMLIGILGGTVSSHAAASGGGGQAGVVMIQTAYDGITILGHDFMGARLREGTKYGDINHDVTVLQIVLYNYRFLPSWPDGAFGIQTEDALKEFQAANGLLVSGVLDKATIDAMNKDNAKRKILSEADKKKFDVYNFETNTIEKYSAEDAAEEPVPAQTPAEPEADSQQGLLSFGSHNGQVASLQRELAKRGYNPGADDGIYGAMTEEAVKAFQQDNYLYADGIAGPQTLGLLFAEPSSDVPAAPVTPSVPAPAAAVLSFGSAGGDVKAVQQRLSELGFNPGIADGVYGANTESAVRAFQQANGLYVDGIAGAMTLGLLFGEAAPAGTLPAVPEAAPAEAEAADLSSYLAPVLTDLGVDAATIESILNGTY